VKKAFFFLHYKASSINRFFLALDPFPEVACGRISRTPILAGEEGFFYFNFWNLPEVI
jgi:hypothetical protein